MPRQARCFSESEYYHVMIRGINKQDIFYDDEDRERFSETMQRFSVETVVGIIAWCLMSNHVHLLLFSSDKKENKLSYGMAGKTVHKNKYGHWIKTTSIQPKSIHGLVFPYGYSPITNRCDMKNYLPRYSEWPDGWVMSPSGV